jgi:hypothetical protein
MLYSKELSLEDQLVELVADKRMTLKSIHESVDSLTLRAVYKSVHKLIDAGVLIKVGKYVMLDQEWAARASKALGSGSTPVLSAGERLAYTFTSVEHLDSFWKTIVLPLKSSETFFYNPHNFWAYLPGRKESEDAYYQHFPKSDRYGFFTLGGETAADREFKRSYQNGHFQVDLRNIASFRRTDHITVIGTSVITVRMAKGVSDRIDALYASGRPIQSILPELMKICRKPGKIRFILENNPVKALKLRRALARNFYIQQATTIPSR